MTDDIRCFHTGSEHSWEPGEHCPPRPCAEGDHRRLGYVKILTRGVPTIEELVAADLLARMSSKERDA